MLLGMVSLYLNRTKVDYYDKGIEYLDGNGEQRILQSKKKTTLVRMVKTMHAKCSHMKWCILFVVHISSDRVKDVENF